MASQSPNQTQKDSIGTVAIKVGNRTLYLPFFQGCNSIGRNPNKNIICIDDPTISEIHCILRVTRRNSFVMDFGSFNGTYIGTYENRVRPHQQVLMDLQADALLVAQSKCVFMLEPQWIAHKQREVSQRTEAQNKKQAIDRQSKPGKERQSPEDLILQQKDPVRQKHRRSNDRRQNSSQKNSNHRKVTFSEEPSQVLKPNCPRDDQTRRSRGLKQYRPEQRKESKESENSGSQSRNNIVIRKRKELLQSQSDNSDSGRFTKNKEKKEIQSKKTEKRSESPEVNVESHHGSSLSKHVPLGSQTSFKYNKHQHKSQDSPSLSGVQSPYYQLHGNCRVRVLFSTCSYPQNNGLAIKVVDQKESFDVLIMSSYSRTYKLMMAVLKGKHIVNIAWLHESKKIGKLYNINDYLLQIPSSAEKGQNKNQNILRDSVRKVQEGFKVFEDMNFCLLSNEYSLRFGLFQNLIRLGGGSCIPRRSVQNVIGILSKSDIYQKNTVNKRFPDKKQIYSEELIYDACIYQELSFQRHKVK